MQQYREVFQHSHDFQILYILPWRFLKRALVKRQSFATGFLKVNYNSATSFVFSAQYCNLFGKKRARKNFTFKYTMRKEKPLSKYIFSTSTNVCLIPFLSPSLQFLFNATCYEPSSSLSSHFRQQVPSCILRFTACFVCR